MDKIDYRTVMREFYNAPRKPVVVDVPKINFLMVDGHGNPNTAQEYVDALQVLYPMSYTLKFKLKKLEIADYSVMPLEGLWWMEGFDGFDAAAKDEWDWTALIMQPDIVQQKHVDEAIEEVRKKKNPVALPKLRFEPFEEGLSVQVMHIGPYADEAPTIEGLHAFAEEQGYKLRGKHHEIYLKSPNRTAPEKLKTIIRQPVK